MYTFQLYTECLEMNSLLEINQVCSVITQGYASESNTRRSAKTEEESDIISKLEGNKQFRLYNKPWSYRNKKCCDISTFYSTYPDSYIDFYLKK